MKTPPAEPTTANGTALAPVDKEKKRIIRPVEAAVFEGNISELPMWALSDKHAIPRVTMRDEKGVQRTVPDEKALTRVVTLPAVTLDDGSVAEPRVEIIANQAFGFPTMFAARVLAVVLEKARQRPGPWYTNDVVNIGRWEIATRLGYKPESIGRSTYESIERALEALRATTLEFRSSWYVKSSKRKASIIKATGLISEFQFYDERKERQATMDLLPPETKRSYVRLSDVLMQSLRDGYYHGIDVDYLNALKSPLAERLYLYLAKRDGEGRTTYSEGLRLLASKVSLQTSKPAEMLRNILPALERLSTPLPLTTGARQGEQRRFLSRFEYKKEKELVVLYFYTKAKERMAAFMDQVQEPSPGT